MFFYVQRLPHIVFSIFPIRNPLPQKAFLWLFFCCSSLFHYNTVCEILWFEEDVVGLFNSVREIKKQMALLF